MNIYIILGILLFLIDLSCSITIIFFEKRDTTSTWAWLLILHIFPFLGFILYLCFGQNISKEKIFNKKATIDKHKLHVLLDKIKDKTSVNYGDNEYLDIIKMNFINCGSIYTCNNNIRTYTNGIYKFRDLKNDIKNAKSFINIEYYIFRYDDLGKEIIELLKNKASTGVEVRLLVDGMGSSSLTKKQIKYIKSTGIKFSVFFPSIFSYINLRINYRNHRKIVVIDGKIGYVGGFNIGNEYINKGKQFPFWRDTHLRICGNAVSELNKRFTLDWEYAAKENIYNSQRELLGKTKDYKNNLICSNPSKSPHEADNVGIQIISSGPDNLEEYIRNCYLKIITNAKKNIFIQTPYLVLDEPMIAALKIASSSGVDVRIMVPDTADHFFMAYALSYSIGNLIKYGVKFYKYKKGFIHAKTIVSDSCVSSIGTANLDIRSFKLNFEINAVIYDPVVAVNNENIFIKDQEDCYLFTLDDYLNRGYKIKILESLSRLIFPIL